MLLRVCLKRQIMIRVNRLIHGFNNDVNLENIISLNWPRGYKTFFVLNSVEHEISYAHKYKNIKKFGLFKAQLSLECYFSRSYMLKCQQLLAYQHT